MSLAELIRQDVLDLHPEPPRPPCPIPPRRLILACSASEATGEGLAALAEQVAESKSGEVRNGIPRGMSYAGFRCGKDAPLPSPGESVFGGGSWMN